MCNFLYVKVPAEQSAQLEEFVRAGFEVRSGPQPAPVPGWPPGDEMYAITHGGCACDFFPPPDDAAEESRLRRKYERRGWSQSKCDRAVRSALARGRSAARRVIWDRFLAALAAVVSACGSVGLRATEEDGVAPPWSDPDPAEPARLADLTTGSLRPAVDRPLRIDP